MRIGVYFGSFDPVHENHIALAKHAVEAHGCARVHLVCNVDIPRKPLVSALAERTAFMDARLAADADSLIVRHATRAGQRLDWNGRREVCKEIARKEEARGGAGVTVRVVQLMGQDSFEKDTGAFDNWMTRESIRGRMLLIFPRSTAPDTLKRTTELAQQLAKDSIEVEVATAYRDPHEKLSSTRLRSALTAAAAGGAADAPPEGLHAAVWALAAERRTYKPLPTAPTALHVAILGAPGCGKSTLCTNLTSRLSGLRHLSGGDFHRAAVELLGDRYAEGLPLNQKRRDDLYVDDLSRFLYSCHSVACALIRQAGPCRAVVTDIKSPAAMCILEARHLAALEAADAQGGKTREGRACPTPPTPRAFDLVVVVECSRSTLVSRHEGRAARDGDWFKAEKRVRKYFDDAGTREDQLASYVSARGATRMLRLDGEMDANAMCAAVEAEVRRAAAAKPAVELEPGSAAAIGGGEDAVRTVAAAAVAGARRRALCRQVAAAAWEEGGFDGLTQSYYLDLCHKHGINEVPASKLRVRQLTVPQLLSVLRAKGILPMDDFLPFDYRGKGGGKGGGRGGGGKGGRGKGGERGKGEGGKGKGGGGKGGDRGKGDGSTGKGGRGKGGGGGPPSMGPSLTPHDSDGRSWHGAVSEPGTQMSTGSGKGGDGGKGKGRGGGKGEGKGRGGGRDGAGKGAGRGKGGEGRTAEVASRDWRAR